uniref:FAS1 domain-containing protein n=1 Tax=Ananas comosus var. bracteatus TaxID=296719 RepID=A0A6V7P4Y1_ANACO|nr:unnamed protein product [Ananas comosus var. bracteatus]
MSCLLSCRTVLPASRDEINRRQTITVLVVDNSAAGAFSSLQADVLKRALSVHVILDYYDPYKFERLKSKTALLTTLYQASGVAENRMGFLNYTERTDDERMLFGSAEPGAPLTAELVKVVAARPYNISVLQVTAAIIPPGSTGRGRSSLLRPRRLQRIRPRRLLLPPLRRPQKRARLHPTLRVRATRRHLQVAPSAMLRCRRLRLRLQWPMPPARGLTRLRTTLRRPGGWPLVPAWGCDGSGFVGCSMSNDRIGV